jgi:hypothetical protein
MIQKQNSRLESKVGKYALRGGGLPVSRDLIGQKSLGIAYAFAENDYVGYSPKEQASPDRKEIRTFVDLTIGNDDSTAQPLVRYFQPAADYGVEATVKNDEAGISHPDMESIEGEVDQAFDSILIYRGGPIKHKNIGKTTNVCTRTV